MPPLCEYFSRASLQQANAVSDQLRHGAESEKCAKTLVPTQTIFRDSGKSQFRLISTASTTGGVYSVLYTGALEEQIMLDYYLLLVCSTRSEIKAELLLILNFVTKACLLWSMYLNNFWPSGSNKLPLDSILFKTIDFQNSSASWREPTT